jgi:membrane-bound ClpP family serine protease
MKRNVGGVDKTIRIILGFILFILGYYYQSIWFGVIGLIIILTGILGWCALYKIFKISTYKEKTN